MKKQLVERIDDTEGTNPIPANKQDLRGVSLKPNWEMLFDVEFVEPDYAIEVKLWFLEIDAVDLPDEERFEFDVMLWASQIPDHYVASLSRLAENPTFSLEVAIANALVLMLESLRIQFSKKGKNVFVTADVGEEVLDLELPLEKAQKFFDLV